MTFDTRFLANIDPAFIRATYLDLGRWTDSFEDYEMLAEAITVRLCRYDEHRGYHTSLVGPKLKPRDHGRLKVGDRRYNFPARSVAHLYGAGIASKNPVWVSPERQYVGLQAVDSPYGEAMVERWLDQYEPSDGNRAATDNQVNGPSALDDENLIIFEEAAPSLPSGPDGGKANARLPSQTQSLLEIDDPFVSSESASTSVMFPMGPLKPKPQNASTLTVSKNRYAGPPLVEVDVQEKENDRAGSARAGSMRDASRGSAATKGVISTKSTARPDTAVAQLPGWFIQDTTTAVANLVAAGPYLRGKVGLRADLGRILITGMDYTALAFNASGSASNGWTKDTLLRHLNAGSGRGTGPSVIFTRMLSQDGEDIEHMLTTTDIATGQRLWKSEATERVVYSFHCISQGESFFVDLEADKRSAKFNYSLRTKQDDKSPIWIHCTLRSWDARIIMSHVDTHALEAKYGEFARSFVDSFAVTLPQNNYPQIQIGVHRGFGVSVESMRINSHFRFLSTDEKSYLNITEVEETVFKPSTIPATAKSANGMTSPEEWMFYIVNPKRTASDVRESEERGMPALWYEASITSVAADMELGHNANLPLGGKAPWNYDKLSGLGVVASIVKPALRMVQTMDTVGARNDNRQAAKLVLPRENTQEVPGATYLTKRDSSACSSSSQPRIPLSSPVALVQHAGPPGVVVGRASSHGCPTPPSTVPSPMPAVGGTVTAAASPAQRRGEAVGISRNNQNIVNAFAPGPENGGGGGGFGVTAPRAVSCTRPQGRRDPSSAGSEASRGPAAPYKPPNQFW